MNRFCFPILIYTLVFSTTAAVATPDVSLEVFQPPFIWKGPSVPNARPQPELYNDAHGTVFTAPMQQLEQRAFWETEVNLDLQDIHLISLDIQIDHPTAIKRFSLHFKSGQGWYGGWFNVDHTEWQTISLPKSSFHPEDNPKGWNQISAIRFSAWKQSDQNTTIRLANLRGDTPLIGILLNSDAQKHDPESHAIATRLSNRLAMWFEQEGIAPAIITDDIVRERGIPAGMATLVLPFNPVLTNGIPTKIESYVAAGGKLIVAYTLNPTTARLLGLSGKQWKIADPPGIFTSMQFHADTLPSPLPPVRQDSWNANIPHVDTASVLATWINDKGQNTQIPAATISSNGVFLGHILTNIDRQQKTQNLLMLAALLAPQSAGTVAQARLSSAQSLFEFPSWPHTRTFLENTANRHQTQAKTQMAIRNIETLRDSLLASPNPRANQIRQLADLINKSYIEAIRPINAAPHEFRGVWCHNAQGLPGKNWQQTAEVVKNANFTDIFANILWAGKAYYPSDLLPHGLGTNSTTDLLHASVTAAHEHGLGFHLWMVCWNITTAPDHFLKTMQQENRLQHDANNNTRQWLCPSHPANRRLTVQVAAEATTRYPIDGFHLDYIRFPDGQTCYCQGCHQRFQQQTGITVHHWPADVIEGALREPYRQWRTRLISSMVGTISSTLKRIRPDIKISAAVWPGWPDVTDSLGQDWVSWINKDYIDFICPMSYVTTAPEAVQWLLRHQLATKKKIPIYPGIAPSTHNLSPAQVARQIDALRDAGTTGFMLFDLDPDLAEHHLPALRSGPTAQTP